MKVDGGNYKMKMRCPYCKTELSIKRSMSIDSMVYWTAWQNQTISSVVDDRMKNIYARLEERKIDLNKEYHLYICEECGHMHNGIEGGRVYHGL